MPTYSFQQTDTASRDATSAFDTGQPFPGGAPGFQCAVGGTPGATPDGEFSGGFTGVGVMWETNVTIASFTLINTLTVPFNFTNFGGTGSGTLNHLWLLYIDSGGTGHTIANWAESISMVSPGVKSATGAGGGPYSSTAGDRLAFLLQFNPWSGGYFANDQVITLMVDTAGPPGDDAGEYSLTLSSHTEW